jgi:hypothetical protein
MAMAGTRPKPGAVIMLLAIAHHSIGNRLVAALVAVVALAAIGWCINRYFKGDK